MTGRRLPRPSGGRRRSRRRCPCHPGRRLPARTREGPRVDGRASGADHRLTPVYASWTAAGGGVRGLPERSGGT